MSQRTNPRIKEHGRGPLGVRCRHCTWCVSEPGMGHGGYRSRCTNPKFDENTYTYRSWYACGLYLGPSGTVVITCPNCGRDREIYRSSMDQSTHRTVCRQCSARLAYNRKVDSQRKIVPKLKLPTYNGCYPVRAREGEERVRCHANHECPNYDKCLNYAAKMNWMGWLPVEEGENAKRNGLKGGPQGGYCEVLPHTGI